MTDGLTAKTRRTPRISQTFAAFAPSRFQNDPPEGAIRRNEPLSRHTTFGIGGPAEFFATAEREEDLVALVRWARQEGLPYRVIGSGANLLVDDAGVRGLIIENRVAHCTLRPSEIGNRKSAILHVGSGTILSDLALYTAKRGWAGLEWAVGLPGTVGGAIVGNAGAFGGYMGNVVRQVTILDAEGQTRTLNATECGFIYRGSRFKYPSAPAGSPDPAAGGPGFGNPGRAMFGLVSTVSAEVILAAELVLHQEDVTILAERIQDYTDRRARSQPLEPSAGSVFKRTADHPAGWLIEQVDLKGTCLGGAQISPQHGNFIVNTGGATAEDVKALIELGRHKVKEQFGVDLELEIELV